MRHRMFFEIAGRIFGIIVAREKGGEWFGSNNLLSFGLANEGELAICKAIIRLLMKWDDVYFGN